MYKLFYYLLEITVLGTTPKFLKSFFVKYYIKVSYLNDIEIYNLFISKIWFIKTFNSFKNINDFIDIVCSYNEIFNDGIVKDEDYYNEFNNILKYIIKKYKKYKRKNILLNVR